MSLISAHSDVSSELEVFADTMARRMLENEALSSTGSILSNPLVSHMRRQWKTRGRQWNITQQPGFNQTKTFLGIVIERNMINLA